MHTLIIAFLPDRAHQYEDGGLLYNIVKMYLLFILFVTIFTSLLPVLARYLAKSFPKLKLKPSHSWLPPLAAFMFFSSFFLPEMFVVSETATFQQHFVGGGVFTACLFVYLKKLLGLRIGVVLSVGLLFMTVSAFGAVNELLELALVKMNLSSIDISDTSWDLLANTSGAAAGYLILVLLLVERFNTK